MIATFLTQQCAVDQKYTPLKPASFPNPLYGVSGNSIVRDSMPTCCLVKDTEDKNRSSNHQALSSTCQFGQLLGRQHLQLCSEWHLRQTASPTAGCQPSAVRLLKKAWHYWKVCGLRFQVTSYGSTCPDSVQHCSAPRHSDT
eukprot:GHUV01055834.1.p1 GENE.GHUV01055834.1~~GHUV01055834.1.p1  ORF type:complete len:142 (-),score=24.63 GHUV01055834.1:100-525(-)